MIKYTDTAVTLREIPNEITLCINISNCPCHCKGCHSSYLAEDIGKELTHSELDCLISKNGGITCVAFMGGDSNPIDVYYLCKHIGALYPSLKRAWYSGREQLPLGLERRLGEYDFIKLGPYIEELGPLDNPNTNQKMYKVNKTYEEAGLYVLEDITRLFWKEQP